MPLPEEKLVTGSKDIIAEIRVLFGGRASEELVLDDISTGAYSDIKRATQLAKVYVTKVGMNSEFGPVNLESSDDINYNWIPNISDETSREIDLEVRKMLKLEYDNTLNVLRNNRDKLDAIANLLLEKETVTGAEVRELINPMVEGTHVEESEEMKEINDLQN